MLTLLRTHRELLQQLVARELRGRYKGSVLGLAWSIITPLILAAIYALFFRIVARGAATESIIVGIFGWQFTAICINSGMLAVTGNGNLVKKVRFPRILLPLSVTCSGLIDFLISFAVQLIVVGVLLAMADEPRFFTWHLLLFPLPLLLQFWFNFGITLFLSGLNVYFRDTQHLVGVMITAFFFLSPAMYDMQLVADVAGDRAWVVDVFQLNPMTPILSAYRSCVLGTDFTMTIYTWVGILWPIAFTLLGIRFYRRAQRNFADFL